MPDDFLDGMLAEPAVQPPQAAPEPPAPAPVEQTPTASVETPAPETPATPAAPVTPPPGFVPLAAMLDDREKRQKAEREAESAKAELATLRARQQRPSPSHEDDPNAWAMAQEQRFAEFRRDTVFNQSEMFAVQQHGKDLVEASKAWSEERAKAEFNQYGFSPLVTVLSRQMHPHDWLVKEYQRDQRLTQMGDDPDAWVRKRYAELEPAGGPSPPSQNGTAPPTGTPPQAKPSFVPPKSLVNAPSAGGVRSGIPVGPGAAFETVFPN